MSSKAIQLGNRITEILKEEGPAVLWLAVRRRLANIFNKGTPNKYTEIERYYNWIKVFDTLSDKDIKAIQHKIEQLPNKLLISIIMPVYNVEEKWLRKALNSVIDQLYTNWELCIADDCSPSPHIKKVLDEYAAKDSRIKVSYRSQNGHISEASNTALEMTRGDFTVLMDHDDELRPHSIYLIVDTINRHPNTQLIYSDEDKLSSDREERYAPFFKPDWNLDLFYSMNILSHISAFKTDILKKIGGFRKGYEGSQDYDLALRYIEKIDQKNIRHIPMVLYHWRTLPGSIAMGAEQKDYAHNRARTSLKEHLERTQTPAEVVKGFGAYHRIKYSVPSPAPSVAVIVHGASSLKDETVLKQVKSSTDYPNSKFYRLQNQTINHLIESVQEEMVVLIHADVKPLSKFWLEEMVGQVYRPGVSVVGGKIIRRDNTIESAGFVLGVEGIAAHAFRGLKDTTLHIFGKAHLVQNVSAVSINLMAFTKKTFNKIRGFEQDAGIYSDVDFCLKVQRENQRIVWTPYASGKLRSPNSPTTSSSTPIKKAKQFLRSRWQAEIENDPYFNSNYSHESAHFVVSETPKVVKVWYRSNPKETNYE